VHRSRGSLLRRLEAPADHVATEVLLAKGFGDERALEKHDATQVPVSLKCLSRIRPRTGVLVVRGLNAGAAALAQALEWTCTETAAVLELPKLT
jgi:hypothetical protein